MSQAQEEQNRHYINLELDRQRKLQSAYVDLGVPESAEHSIWLAGYRAAGGLNGRPNGLGAAQDASCPQPMATHASAVMENEEEDPTKRTIMMYSASKARWYTLTVNFDPGTPENWMSPHVVNLLDLPVQVVVLSSYETSNGQTLSSTEAVKGVLWCGENAPRTRQADFRLAHNAPFDVLFGNNLLISEDIHSLNKHNLILTKKVETKAGKAVVAKNRTIVEAEAVALERKRQTAETAKKMLANPPPAGSKK